jgi:hypothetical protein
MREVKMIVTVRLSGRPSADEIETLEDCFGAAVEAGRDEFWAEVFAGSEIRESVKVKSVSVVPF